jgi:AcrR family transcriptional regulator
MGEIVTFERFAPALLDEAEDRIVDAVLDCVRRWGLAKTTADDIARAAGVSRATLYRAFPGGKDVLFDAAVRREAARFFLTITDELEAAEDLEALLVVGITSAARFLSGHEALRYVLEHEPERVLPAFTFDRLARTLEVATAFAAPHLERFLGDPGRAADGAELVVRVLLSYAVNPTGAVLLTDIAAVRRFVRTHLAPALQAPIDSDAAPGPTRRHLAGAPVSRAPGSRSAGTPAPDLPSSP